MSSVIVEVVQIDAIGPHTQADRLYLAQIKGWQTVIRKLDDGRPEFQEGERVVYILPDSTLPRELAARLEGENYVSERTNIHGERELVVRRVRLRGRHPMAWSFVLIIRPGRLGQMCGSTTALANICHRSALTQVMPSPIIHYSSAIRPSKICAISRW